MAKPTGSGGASFNELGLLDWGIPTVAVYLTRLSAIVVRLTQGDDIHRNLVRTRTDN